MPLRQVLLTVLLLVPSSLRAQEQPPPTTAPAATDDLPHLLIDVKNRLVRVDCEMVGVDAPLEFFCVLSGTAEHEAVLRTRAMPSHVHLALLMIGLQPGHPVRHDPQTDTWLPPTGPPLRIDVEFEKDGQAISLPAHALLKNLNTGEPAPPLNWVFAGSQMLEQGGYGADATGYVVSLVNFGLSLIDVAELASNSNDQLTWLYNAAKGPPQGTPVAMILRPAEDAPPATQPGAR